MIYKVFFFSQDIHKPVCSITNLRLSFGLLKLIGVLLLVWLGTWWGLIYVFTKLVLNEDRVEKGWVDIKNWWNWTLSRVLQSTFIILIILGLSKHLFYLFIHLFSSSFFSFTPYLFGIIVIYLWQNSFEVSGLTKL